MEGFFLECEFLNSPIYLLGDIYYLPFNSMTNFVDVVPDLSCKNYEFEGLFGDVDTLFLYYEYKNNCESLVEFYGSLFAYNDLSKVSLSYP
jgi:hypothetical protein